MARQFSELSMEEQLQMTIIRHLILHGRDAGASLAVDLANSDVAQRIKQVVAGSTSEQLVAVAEKMERHGYLHAIEGKGYVVTPKAVGDNYRQSPPEIGPFREYLHQPEKADGYIEMAQQLILGNEHIRNSLKAVPTRGLSCRLSPC
jgi:hypothetical protein